MAKVKELYANTRDLFNTYSKEKLAVWLEHKENLILFENFLGLLKDNMIEALGNVD